MIAISWINSWVFWIKKQELPKENLKVTAICYLCDFGLFSLRTNLGHAFFGNLGKNHYLPLIYEKVIRHNRMMMYICHGKENNNVKYVLSCSVNGTILL